ncbi:M20/M25/M40 family metallo-hydrolase [uncultured Campylobacter sp.]|uniref:M20/M25/M40 family metallo-hydrolase n=1 Tax=uncultured Campylobacter sp. TaxID=218934 RepID=UPI00260F5CE2|nr:M20/M25/M40 family metallo-hydrolase [uncultured Campylobacter sp.]
MKEVVDNFKKISKIPHCSFDTKKLCNFLVDFAKKNGCEVKLDSAFNIHCIKGKPKLCLQSHYDMVCMGEAPNIELKEENFLLKAVNSSLGADNGMGVAMMMQIIKDFDNIECIFTNDEEVGLIGANNLEHKIKSKLLLNLDHEVENEVVIGCAGGLDIKASLNINLKEEEGELYELEAINFKGGHSGIDIISNEKNSIKEMAAFILKNNGKIVYFEGGERINSIARYAKARVFFKKTPKDSKYIKCKYLGLKKEKIIKQNSKLIKAINAFSQGVRAYDKKLGIVRTSINLSLLRMKDKKVNIELFARSNLLEDLLNLKEETKIFFSSFGFKLEFHNFYAPWQAKESEFSKVVLNSLKKKVKNAKILEVHAGLECGIIEKKQKINCVSIGPNIYNPHSTDEKCDLKSLERIYEVLKDVVKIYG